MNLFYYFIITIKTFLKRRKINFGNSHTRDVLAHKIPDLPDVERGYLLEIGRAAFTFLTKNAIPSSDKWWNFAHTTTGVPTKVHDTYTHTEAMTLGSEIGFYDVNKGVKDLQLRIEKSVDLVPVEYVGNLPPNNELHLLAFYNYVKGCFRTFYNLVLWIFGAQNYTRRFLEHTGTVDKIRCK